MTGDETADIAPPSFKQGVSHAAKTLAVIWRTSPDLTLIIAVSTIIVALLPAAAAYVSQLVIDGVLNAIESGAAADQRTALIWVAVEAGLIASLLAGRRMLLFFKTRLHAELGYGVTRMILDKSLSLSLAQIEDPLVQQQLVLARQHAANRPYNLVNRIFTGAQSLLTLLSVAALLIGFSPWLILLVVAGGVPLFIGDLYFAGTAFRFYTGRTPQMRERSYLESLMTSDSLAQERLHYNTGPEIKRRYTTLFDWLYGKDRTLQARRAWAQTVLSLVSSAVFLGGKVWIVIATIATIITLGQMTMLVGLLKQGQSAVTTLLAAFNGIVEDILYVSNLYAMLDLPTDNSTNDRSSGPHPGSGLRLDDVSFTYPGQNRAALSGVSFKIPQEARVGIVGANGSGKTTLVKLLTGLYQPHSGEVSLDGLSLDKWNRQSLTRRMGVMFQPFNRYKLSARDNIAVGDAFQTSDDERLLAAADRGLAGDLVRNLPNGLDTRLSKRFLGGLELSGGQWQRLAMARAYLNETADILILDEPTAAMDPLAEAKFMQQDRAGKTSILISHRLSNIRHADLILVLDDGRLVEQGTHDALMEVDGLYARLFNTQASAYRSGD